MMFLVVHEETQAASCKELVLMFVRRFALLYPTVAESKVLHLISYPAAGLT